MNSMQLQSQCRLQYETLACFVSHCINWFVDLCATVITLSFSAISKSRKCHCLGSQHLRGCPSLHYTRRRQPAPHVWVARVWLSCLSLSPCHLLAKGGSLQHTEIRLPASRESLSPAYVGHSGPNPTCFPANLRSLAQSKTPNLKSTRISRGIQSC